MYFRLDNIVSLFIELRGFPFPVKTILINSFLNKEYIEIY